MICLDCFYLSIRNLGNNFIYHFNHNVERFIFIDKLKFIASYNNLVRTLLLGDPHCLLIILTTFELFCIHVDARIAIVWHNVYEKITWIISLVQFQHHFTNLIPFFIRFESYEVTLIHEDWSHFPPCGSTKLYNCSFICLYFKMKLLVWENNVIWNFRK